MVKQRGDSTPSSNDGSEHNQIARNTGDASGAFLKEHNDTVRGTDRVASIRDIDPELARWTEGAASRAADLDRRLQNPQLLAEYGPQIKGILEYNKVAV